MASSKCPPALPVEVWIDILRYNDPRPLKLKALAEIKTAASDPFSDSFCSVTRPRCSGDKESFVGARNEAFLAPLALAATHNSLMKKYCGKDGCEEGNLLAAFCRRLGEKNRNDRQMIVCNYLRKNPLDGDEKNDHENQKQRQAIRDEYGEKNTVGWGSYLIDDFDLAMSFATTRTAHSYRHDRWLRRTSDRIRAHGAFILAAAKIAGTALMYASAELQNDRAFVLSVVKENASSLFFAGDALKNDKEVVLAAVKQDVTTLRDASGTLKSDKAFMLVAVKLSGKALYYASDALKNDLEVVSAAIEQSAEALYHASDALRNNRDIVFAALKQDSWAMAYASAELRDDQEFMLAAMNQES